MKRRRCQKLLINRKWALMVCSHWQRPIPRPIKWCYVDLFGNGKNRWKQECIPVGCVPAARWPYAGVCLLRGGGGVCSQGGWSKGGLVPGGICSGGVSSQGGLVLGGSGSGGGLLLEGCIPACTEADTPPVDRHMLVKILPWPNFVAAGNQMNVC